MFELTMDKQRVKKAEIRLLGVNIALADLAVDQPYNVFQTRWFGFLTAWKSVYTQLEQGAKVAQSSLDWFEAKKAERLSDPLLKYLYEARNDDEHGLEEPTKLVPTSYMIGVRREGYSNHVSCSTAPDGRLVFESLDSLPLLTQIVPAHAQLASVTTRYGKILAPPTHHLGLLLTDQSPFNVAKLGLDYLTRLVTEAVALTP